MSDNAKPAALTPPAFQPAPMVIDDYQKSEGLLKDMQTATLARFEPILFGTLKNAGIARVIVSFNGEGDEGQIESVDAYGGDDQARDLPTDTITYL